jgi:lipid-A-disaccharide synthase-like uncharacterized protein
MTPHLALQIRVSKTLSYGFIFTLLPALGLLSLAAFFIGWWARRTIKRADVPLAGIVMAWWCIIIGGAQTLIYAAAGISLLLSRG